MTSWLSNLGSILEDLLYPRPEDPPIPSDRASYGSASWPWDKAEAVLNQSEAGYVLLYFDMKGFNFAQDIYSAYLANLPDGYIYQVPQNYMAEILATDDVTRQVGECLDWIKKEAATLVSEHSSLESVPIGYPKWEVVYPTNNSDVTYALGHFSISMGSIVSATNKGGTISATIEYVVYAYDYYYFHQSEQSQLDVENAFKQGVDGDMRQLEEAGWARSFRVHGSGPVTTWSGTLPSA